MLTRLHYKQDWHPNLGTLDDRVRNKMIVNIKLKQKKTFTVSGFQQKLHGFSSAFSSTLGFSTERQMSLYVMTRDVTSTMDKVNGQ